MHTGMNDEKEREWEREALGKGGRESDWGSEGERSGEGLGREGQMHSHIEKANGSILIQYCIQVHHSIDKMCLCPPTISSTAHSIRSTS